MKWLPEWDCSLYFYHEIADELIYICRHDEWGYVAAAL